MWAAALAAALAIPAAALDNGLGRTPPMGYSTWNHFRCKNLTADNIMKVVDALIYHGLDKVGYRYVNIDDCWAGKRDDQTHIMVPDLKAFPQGMNVVSDYIHSKGLKFGIYTDRGAWTCAARPGSQGYEQVDAQTYAAWGVDYVKEDSCNAPENPDEAIRQYTVMRDALNATGRPMYFSLCGWRPWYAVAGAPVGNSWRVAGDVNGWTTVYNSLAINAQLAPYAGPGAWNDPDMLVGSTVEGAAAHNTPVQARTQFSLWAVMAAPLLIGSNLLALSEYDRSTYMNMEVIAVDQDPLGIQGVILWEDCPKQEMKELIRMTGPVPSCSQVWGKRLLDGAYAVILVNWAVDAAWVAVDDQLMAKMGFKGGAHVRDLWAAADLGLRRSVETRICGDGCSAMYRFSPTSVVV